MGDFLVTENQVRGQRGGTEKRLERPSRGARTFLKWNPRPLAMRSLTSTHVPQKKC